MSNGSKALTASDARHELTAKRENRYSNQNPAQDSLTTGQTADGFCRAIDLRTKLNLRVPDIREKLKRRRPNQVDREDLRTRLTRIRAERTNEQKESSAERLAHLNVIMGGSPPATTPSGP